MVTGLQRAEDFSATSRVQLLTIEGLLSGKHRAEHPDHQPDLNFKRAQQEEQWKQKDLI